MDNLLAARIQMAFSLAFHMFFAALGVGMPLFMLIAEGRWLRTGRRRYLELAQTWGKATGILFAIGAVSGTALSFELGLLWPAFMEFAGSTIGSAFTLEAYAFFIEAIFLGLYLYGWERLSPRAHWLCGIPVAVSGAASSVLVVASNAWMQYPLGADLLRTRPDAVNPAAMLFGNPMWPIMAVHSTLACYAATAFAVMGVYAWGALRGRKTDVQRSALRMAVVIGTFSAVAMPLTGDLSAKAVAQFQPVKLAAMESQFTTERSAPLRLGGLPRVETGEVPYAVEIPGMLSWLAYGDAGAEVMGLDRVPRNNWPNVPLTHVAFQVMVLAGFVMLAAVAWYWLVSRRRQGELLADRWLMRGLVASSPLGFIALQAGWVVTEIGRQPWIVQGVMRTRDAVTPAPGVVFLLTGWVVLYLTLAATLVWLLLKLRHDPAREVEAR